MGPLGIINRPPIVKGQLHLCTILPAASHPQHFGLQRPVKPFLLALRLWDDRARPDGPQCPSASATRPARCTPSRRCPKANRCPTADHRAGHTSQKARIRCPLEPFGPAGRLRPPATRCSGSDHPARTADNNAPAATGNDQLKSTCHSLIGLRPLKSLAGRASGRLAACRSNQAVAMQNAGDRAGRRQLQLPQTLRVAAAAGLRAPRGRMLDAAPTTPIRSSTTAEVLRGLCAVGANDPHQRRLPASLIPRQPLCSPPGRAGAPNRWHNCRTFASGCSAKFTNSKTYMNQVFHRPRHRFHTRAGSSRQMSTMSPHTRPLCTRSIHPWGRGLG